MSKDHINRTTVSSVARAAFRANEEIVEVVAVDITGAHTPRVIGRRLAVELEAVRSIERRQIEITRKPSPSSEHHIARPKIRPAAIPTREGRTDDKIGESVAVHVAGAADRSTGGVTAEFAGNSEAVVAIEIGKIEKRRGCGSNPRFEYFQGEEAAGDMVLRACMLRRKGGQQMRGWGVPLWKVLLFRSKVRADSDRRCAGLNVERRTSNFERRTSKMSSARPSRGGDVRLTIHFDVQSCDVRRSTFEPAAGASLFASDALPLCASVPPPTKPLRAPASVRLAVRLMPQLVAAPRAQPAPVQLPDPVPAGISLDAPRAGDRRKNCGALSRRQDYRRRFPRARAGSAERCDRHGPAKGRYFRAADSRSGGTAGVRRDAARCDPHLSWLALGPMRGRDGNIHRGRPREGFWR